MAITPLPPAPAITDDTATFNSKAFAFVDALDDFATEANALAVAANADASAAAGSAVTASGFATQAQTASNAAVGAANFKGEWSTLTGALAIPASVSHIGSVWILTESLADVTAVTPGSDSRWINSAPAAGTLQAIASGALSDGSTVVVNADGTVSVVVGVAGAVVFESAFTESISATFDSTNNKVVIAYRDSGNSNFGTAIVGTVSGSSISFGTAVVFISSAIDQISATFDSTNDRVVIAYRESSVGKAIVGTVSGTSISFGTAVTFHSTNASFISATFDSTNDKVVIAYRDGGNSGFGTAVVGTVSGTAISFGTAVVFESASTTNTSATFDSTNNKVVIAYRDGGNSGFGTAIVGTVSGTAISFGTAVVFESAATDHISATYDSTNDRVVIAYQDSGNTSFGTAIVGTVSGTAISFGTAVVFESASTTNTSATYNSTNDRVVISYTDGGNSGFGTAIVGTVSGTIISFGTAIVFESAATTAISATFDSTNNKVVIAYRDSGNSGFGTARLFTGLANNLTAENYIGISNGAYADAATATIQIVGSVDDAQFGLTAGQSYFVQGDGTLSETPGTPSVFAGTAVSATKLIVKG